MAFVGKMTANQVLQETGQEHKELCPQNIYQNRVLDRHLHTSRGFQQLFLFSSHLVIASKLISSTQSYPIHCR